MGHVPLLILPIIPLALIGNHPAPLRARLAWSLGLVVWLVAGTVAARHGIDILASSAVAGQSGAGLARAAISMYLVVCGGAWLSYFLFRRRHPAALPPASGASDGVAPMQQPVPVRNARTPIDKENSVTTFQTSREIPASAEQIFAAIGNPERLARWWGPAGFRNSFAICDFAPGGRWSFVMHGPDGGNYQNESVFAEIEAPRKVVIQHMSEPRFHLTISLHPSATGTVVSWVQAFADAEVARRVEHIVVPANEQNLDRLSAEVLQGATGD